MRISDWSSDVCSSDLVLDTRIRRGDYPDFLIQDLKAIADRAPANDARQSGDTQVGQRSVVGLAVHHPCGQQHHRRSNTLRPDDGGESAVLVLAKFVHGIRSHLHVVVGGLRSEEHTSELQSLMRISYAVFCLKKK